MVSWWSAGGPLGPPDLRLLGFQSLSLLIHLWFVLLAFLLETLDSRSVSGVSEPRPSRCGARMETELRGGTAESRADWRDLLQQRPPMCLPAVKRAQNGHLWPFRLSELRREADPGCRESYDLSQRKCLKDER